jgi:hypothetical protein
MLIPISSAVDIRSDLEDDNVKIYKFARIKTTETSGGYAFCFPGFFRSVYHIGNILFHSFVAYDNNYWGGWYLTINGEKISRGRGYIFGFTGRITNWLGGFGTKPDEDYFDLDGFALQIIHISD